MEQQLPEEPLAIITEDETGPPEEYPIIAAGNPYGYPVHCVSCGWTGYRTHGPLKPCPKCGGVVVWTFTGKTKPIVASNPDEWEGWERKLKEGYGEYRPGVSTEQVEREIESIPQWVRRRWMREKMLGTASISNSVTVACPLCGDIIEIPQYNAITRSDALIDHLRKEHRGE